ncbi:MAG: iron ABC transporter permease [Deltaproteobacteria bacterium]|nr:MAG: iron ABC transporter permease [Deltaproteobacteria bacterium]
MRLLDTRTAVLGGAVALLTGLVVVPLGLLGLRLLADPAAGIEALGNGLNLAAALNTLILSLSVLAFTVFVGVPLGWLVGRTDLPGARTWRAVCTVPYVVPPYITAIAWITLLNPTNGLLNRAMAGIAGPLDIYTLAGMTWVMGLAYTPFVMLATADSLSRMDASLEEQARIAGASPLRTLFAITLPMAAPGIWTGASFVLAASAASFGVPYLLASGAVEPDFVLTTRIYQALDLDPATGRPVAVALSLVLLAIGIGLPALGRLLQGRRKFTTVTGKATRAAPFALGRATPAALAFVGAYSAVAVALPLVTIAVTSLMGNFGRGLGADNLTLANYSAVLFERSDTLEAIGRSLFLAAAAATGAVLLGGLLGWMAKRTDARGRQVVVSLARLPYAVPGTVLALALILAFSQEIRLIVLERLTIGLALADTLWMLGLAYMVKFLAFPVGNTEAGLEATDASLEEQARIAGAGWGTTMAKITGPLLLPNLVAAWFLVFMPAFSEVTMSILLSGPDTRVVGTLLFELQTYGDPPSAAVLAMVVTVLVLGGNAGLRVMSRGKVGL